MRAIVDLLVYQVIDKVESDKLEIQVSQLQQKLDDVRFASQMQQIVTKLTSNSIANVQSVTEVRGLHHQVLEVRNCALM